MNDVSLREFVETIMEERDRRYNELRKGDLRSFEIYKEEVQRALALAKSNSDRVLAMIISVVALIISTMTAIFVYLK